MKKSLTHLPEHKRDELEHVVALIHELIEAECVILFGSYARGDWVEDVYEGDDGITYEYKSDYDLLLIVEDLPKYEYKGYRDRIRNKARRSEKCATRLSIITHSVDEFREAIETGKYFFTDIRKEGILLHASSRFRLPVLKEISEKQRKLNAEEDFAYWFESAKEFFDSTFDNIKSKRYKIAAFELHQATERLYHAVLLVCTGYKPKIHDLVDLGVRVDRLSSKFKNIFPRKTEVEKHHFDLLKRAYIDARYNKKYKVTQKELEYLSQRVLELQAVTEEVCREKMKSFIV